MKFSTIAATSIIASKAVSGNEVTNLRKLKATTSESGNKFRRRTQDVFIVGCDDGDGGDPVCEEEEDMYGGKYEVCVKCDGGAGIAFNFAITDGGISAGLVLASDDGVLDGVLTDASAFCVTAFLLAADAPGAKYQTKCASDEGSFELEVKFKAP